MIINTNTDPSVNNVIGSAINLHLIGTTLAIQLPKNLAQVIILIVTILPTIIFILSFIMILRGAINWVRSNGNEKELEKAQKTIKNAIIGFFLMFVFILVSNIATNLLIGFSLGNAFYALAPCGTAGTVSDILAKAYGNSQPGGTPTYSDGMIEAAYINCQNGVYH